ncbi:DUF3093 domain-containing protein [Nocardioides sp. AE5]|uniref:DUF3093 domain-containing protein n=1 Tax=Nocardioides sp. AE5 TaxID=2962573 RepID=UPI002881E48C|nr:DUF3093 domain-containing protein [Nocardioides sp. AE5]MDT0201382.1 DUF3093 domain-containing protein [Nocardioides sp. AE5]
MPYAERLTVPLRWWVQGTMLVASFWFAVAVAIPTILGAALLALAVGLLVAAGFINYGSARVAVEDGELRAGKAHIPVALIGEVEALDKERTHLVAGREADARAYLLMRPYLKRSVKVTINDERDPTPYWLISTRHPKRLAAAIEAAR